MGNQAGDVKVVGADEAAVAHVDQLPFDRGQAAAADHREQAFVRRAVAGIEHPACLVQGHKQQLVLVRYDDVAGQQVADAAAVNRTCAHGGHSGGGEAFRQEGHDVFVGRRGRVFSRAAGNVGQAARAGHQPHTHFDQADVAFHRRYALGGIHRYFTAATQRQAANGRHHRHRRVSQLEHHGLQFGFHAVQRVYSARHEGRQHGLQISPGREHLVVRPDDHAFVAGLSQIHPARQAFGHVGADGVHFGFDAGDQHVALNAVQGPQTNRVVFMQRGACGGERRSLRAQHVFGEVLAGIHRQAAARNECLRRGTPGALRRVHTASLSHRPVEYPVRQRRSRNRGTRFNVFLDPVRDLQPACFLPQLKRPLAGAEAPAHGKVDVARGFGNGGQVNGRVMKLVPQNRPQETSLSAFRVAQQGQAFTGGLFQHAADHVVGLGTAGHVFHAFRVQPQNIAADFFIKTRTGFLAQAFGFEQLGQHRRCAVDVFKRVRRRLARTQVVLQRLDDMRHRVQAHHVRRAEGA